MNIQAIHQILSQESTLRSSRHLDRYVKLMEHYINNPCIKSMDNKGQFERHHILPRKMWPEYEKEYWNIVVLPTKAHYLAHYLLFKCFSHASCVFAFNQMRRVRVNLPTKTCRLYEAARLELAQQIFLVNSGREMSLENKVKRAKLFKGTNVYRHKETGELQRFPVGQQPLEWEPFQTGRIRTAQSKKQMSDKMSNRIWQYDPVTQDIKFAHELLPGYVQGYPEWAINNENTLKDHKWIHDPTTGLNLRIHKNSAIPHGYKKGRLYNNKGFALINNKDKMRVISLSQKQFVMIDKSAFDPLEHMTTGSSLEATVVYEYKNQIYTNFVYLLATNPELPEFKTRTVAINNQFIPKPHANMTPMRRQFCELNQRKSVTDIGLRVIPVLSYEHNKDKINVNL